MLKKIFGGIRMTWPRLIAFAVISGVITGLIALLVPEGNSFRQIAVTLEAWIVLAIIVVVNCEKPTEAALKTFVYFLISQPLVYLVQVPFNSLGFGLFRFYTYWFYLTLATLPGGFIAWQIKRDDPLAAVVLSVALSMLIVIGGDYLKTLVTKPPRYLVATLFCFGSVPLLILGILHKRLPRTIASVIAVLALAGSLYWQFAGPNAQKTYNVSFGVDSSVYPLTEEWTVRLADPDNGTAVIIPGDDVIAPRITVEIIDPDKSADIILVDPDGNEYLLPAEMTLDGNGNPTFLY